MLRFDGKQQNSVKQLSFNTKIKKEKIILGFFGYIPRSGNAGSYSSSIFSFLRNLHNTSHSGCANLLFHQQWDGSLFPTSSPTFVICVVCVCVCVCVLLDDSHSGKCEVRAHCGFDLYFSDD